VTASSSTPRFHNRTRKRATFETIIELSCEIELDMGATQKPNVVGRRIARRCDHRAQARDLAPSIRAEVFEKAAINAA
jgi:hypothetical protein